MKKSKSFLMFTFLLLITNFLNAQENLEEKANKLVAEMSEKLINAEAPILTLDQEKNLTTLYLEKLKEIKAIKKEVSNNEEQKEKIKEVNKSYGKKVYDTILTKEQKTALKAYKKNKE